MYTLVTYTLRVLAVNVNVQLLTTFVPATHSMDSLRLCLQLITPIVHYHHRAITVSDAAPPQQTIRNAKMQTIKSQCRKPLPLYQAYSALMSPDE